jgi:hypothetical protein
MTQTREPCPGGNRTGLEKHVNNNGGEDLTEIDRRAQQSSKTADALVGDYNQSRWRIVPVPLGEKAPNFAPHAPSTAGVEA